jgi:hypothetical protein
MTRRPGGRRLLRVHDSSYKRHRIRSLIRSGELSGKGSGCPGPEVANCCAIAAAIARGTNDKTKNIFIKISVTGTRYFTVRFSIRLIENPGLFETVTHSGGASGLSPGSASAAAVRSRAPAR